jgi:hypothetical protein
MLLFRAQRRSLTNHLEKKGFLRILKANIASEQGEKAG